MRGVAPSTRKWETIDMPEPSGQVNMQEGGGLVGKGVNREQPPKQTKKPRVRHLHGREGEYRRFERGGDECRGGREGRVNNPLGEGKKVLGKAGCGKGAGEGINTAHNRMVGNARELAKRCQIIA